MKRKNHVRINRSLFNEARVDLGNVLYDVVTRERFNFSERLDGGVERGVLIER